MRDSDIEIRSLREDDVREIRNLSEGLGLSPWTRQDYLDEMRRSDAHLMVAVKDESVIGFLVSRRVPGAAAGTFDAEIYNIGVREEYQGSSIGQKLMGDLVRECRDNSVRDVWLEVRRKNMKAIRFYKRFGFKEDGIRPAFYQHPPDDAVTMHLTIPAQTNELNVTNP